MQKYTEKAFLNDRNPLKVILVFSTAIVPKIIVTKYIEIPYQKLTNISKSKK